MGTSPKLVSQTIQLKSSRRLIPHAAAIAIRAATLERWAPGILISVDGYLDFVEPHLDTILERLDQIEPHLPFVLEHLDVLAPHCGVLLQNIDRLLLFADDGGKYLDPLLPWVPEFVDKLEVFSPHFILLRPHFKYVLPHFDVIAPSAMRFKDKLDVSRYADVLVWYFGWVLRIPFVAKFILKVPGMPSLANFLARRLPRWPVRRTWKVECDYSGCEVYI